MSVQTRKILIGTAGWANPPAERSARRAGESHLQHYAAQFNAVEINSSFYRSHQRATYERWRESTPASFCFSVKAPRSVTHESELKGCRVEMRRFLDEVAGLGRKLRVILLQTPASLAFEPRTVSSFLAWLTDVAHCQIVWEARHPAWFGDKADAVLSRYGIARVRADPSRQGGADQAAAGERFVYYRLHGSPRMYYSAYTEEFMNGLHAKMLRDVKPKEVWFIFDNTARHASWDNARYLSHRVGRSRA